MANLALVTEEGTGKGDRRVVAEAPLRIGRGADADWRIAADDPMVSRTHAVVRAEGESLVIEDTSSNGLFVNDEAMPLGAGNARRLVPGDRIRMGGHVFRVTRDGHASTPPSLDGGGWFDEAPLREEAPASQATGNGWFDEDWLEAGAIQPASHPGEPGRRRPAPPIPPPLEQLPMAPDLPDDNPFAESRGEPEATLPASRPPSPEPPANIPSTDDRLLQAFLRGAGLDARALGEAEAEALMESAGARLRDLAFGLTQLLRARAEFKDAARIARTRISGTGNNPLKLAVSPEEALLAVLVARDSAYLSPETAVAGAFGDLRDHELRMLEAIQVALNSLLARFDPVNFEAELEQESRLLTLVAGGRRSRCWELFRERFAAMSAEARNRFLGEIGPDFAAAYEGDDGYHRPPPARRHRQ